MSLRNAPIPIARDAATRYDVDSRCRTSSAVLYHHVGQGREGDMRLRVCQALVYFIA